MSYVDVERSEEALLEDEELIEAVESLVETAATSLKSEILLALEEFWQSIVSWLEWLFPIWLEYQHNESLFWEDLDKLALFTVLFVISFFLLAPSSTGSDRVRRKQRRNCPPMLRRHISIARIDTSKVQTASLHESHASFFEQQQQLQQPPPLQPSSAPGPRLPSTICSGRVILEEDDTDEEQFYKLYDSIRMSRYRRLVLPPECKLVEKPKRASTTSTTNKPKENSNTTTNNNSNENKQKNEKKKKKQQEANNDDDHPARRLQLYFTHFLYLVKSFLSYDYMGAGWTLIHWLQTLLRIRKYRRSNSPDDVADDDDDDDDESKASASASASQASTTQASSSSVRHSITSIHAPLTPERYDYNDYNSNNSNSNSHPLDHSFQSTHMEEKKESPHHGSTDNDYTSPLAFVNHHQHHYPEKNGYKNSRRDSVSEVIGEPDEASCPSIKMPLSASLSYHSQGSASAGTPTTNLRPSFGGKKKDLLENYRSSTNHNASFLGASLQRPNTSSSHNNFPSTSQSTCSSSFANVNTSSNNSLTHSNSNGSDDTEVTRNHIPDDLSTIGDPCDPQHDDNAHLSAGMPEANNRFQRMDSDSAFFFETANTQESLYQMSLEAPMPDKNGYIVGDEFLPDANCTPLLVFVNSRSGPQQGHLLITQLRRLLNPIQVWDLADGGPETILESFCVFRNLRILVCGGDGTVAWIVATLEKMNLKRKWPPIAILPLGTGNDLARIHGWGGGYNNESLIGILEQVSDSYISLLDRWEMTIENRKGKVKEVKSFFNYLGVGADAQAALQVHMLRESKPQLFFSRVVNKAWYGVFGAEDIIKATSLNLPNEITLIADGVEVPLPPDSQGIILLNIDSYAGGIPMWANGAKSVAGLHGYGYSSTSDVGTRTYNSGGNRLHQPGHLRRTRSLEDLGIRRHNSDGFTLERIDSMEDLTQSLTDDQRFERVTACNMPSSCQDGILDVISIRGAFHLGQIRVGLSNAQRICQCREATIHIKRKVAVQIDGEPWRQNVCTLRVKRNPHSAIMLHKSEDENGVETEMAKLLDWAEERRLINSNVHYTLMKEFSRRIEYKTRQRRHRSQDNLMFSLKRAIGSTGALSSYGGNYEYP